LNDSSADESTAGKFHISKKEAIECISGCLGENPKYSFHSGDDMQK
jgi:hypothetical protein